MQTEDKTFHVWAWILTLSGEIWEYIAIIKAYKKISAKGGNKSGAPSFLDVAVRAIWGQLLLDISKVFDRARTFENENCSIDLLKELIQKSSIFSEAEKVQIVQEANQLCEGFDEIVTREMRNKQIAHYDLKVLLDHVKRDVNSEKLEEFAVCVVGFLSKVSLRFLDDRARVRFCSLEDVMKKYEDDMIKIYKSNRTLFN